MKALILASGRGKRLKPLTDQTHKGLIKIGEKTILARIIEAVEINGIDDFVITTGAFREELTKFVKKNYPKLKVTFVYNDKYRTTNYIYSMWLARKYLEGEDVLYLHSDVLFDPILIKKLLEFPHSSVLVNRNFRSEKDFNANIIEGKVMEISVKITGDSVGFCLPIYKLLSKDLAVWLNRIDEYIEDGRTNCYAELALNDVLGQVDLRPTYFDKEIGIEIDDMGDLYKANSQKNLITKTAMVEFK